MAPVSVTPATVGALSPTLSGSALAVEKKNMAREALSARRERSFMAGNCATLSRISQAGRVFLPLIARIITDAGHSICAHLCNQWLRNSESVTNHPTERARRAGPCRYRDLPRENW